MTIQEAHKDDRTITGINVTVKITPNRFPANAPPLKIPHMGWNELNAVQEHPLLEGIGAGAHAYFVHSFELKPVLEEDLIATADYGGPLTAMVGNGMAGAAAVEDWVNSRRTEVERIRAAIHEIAGSGLTLSKLSVAASMLGDLARG